MNNKGSLGKTWEEIYRYKYSENQESILNLNRKQNEI